MGIVPSEAREREPDTLGIGDIVLLCADKR